jgi:predicted amidohydrolase
MQRLSVKFVVSVAIAQFSPGEDKTANLASLRSLAQQAAGQGAGIVVAPEYSMFTAGRLDERYSAAAEPLDGPFVTGVRSIASDTGIVVVCGVAESQPGDSHIFNTVVAAGPGEVLATYRKLHLYDAFGFLESAIVSPGPVTDPALFSVDGTIFGIQTCYDLRFPEVTRRLAIAGADAVLVPAQWIPGPLKEDHWTTLLRARAIENTIYICGAGQAAPTGAGNSMIVDPSGIAIAALGDQIGTASSEISPDRVLAVRKKNPSLAHRRLN